MLIMNPYVILPGSQRYELNDLTYKNPTLKTKKYFFIAD